MDKVLDDKLNSGALIILDGATGSEIPNFGGQLDEVSWCGAANKYFPDAVRKVHEAYLHAGADIITANTFATCRHVLDGVQLGAEAAAITGNAVALAKQARDNVKTDRPVAIAGSMSTTWAWLAGTVQADERFYPDKNQCEKNYHEMAEALAKAGIDFFILEMMSDLEFAPLVAKAAKATGLPIWVGLSCSRLDDGTLTAWDLATEHPKDIEAGKCYPAPASLEVLIDTFAALEPQVMGIMHSQVATTFPALRLLRQHWHGPMMSYPEALGFEDGHRKGTSSTPEAFAQSCAQLVDEGVQIIGGCCGTTIKHCEAMMQKLTGRVA